MQSNQIDSLFCPTQFFSGHKKPKQAWIFSLSQKIPPSDFRPRRRVGGRTGATSPCFTKKQYWDRCSTCFVPWWRPHLGNSHLFLENTHEKPMTFGLLAKMFGLQNIHENLLIITTQRVLLRSFRQPKRNKNTTQTFQKNPVPNPISGASTSFRPRWTFLIYSQNKSKLNQDPRNLQHDPPNGPRKNPE